MLNLVFLDDERNFEDVTWVDYKTDEELNVCVVRNPLQFRTAILPLLVEEGALLWVSFDHDIQSFDSECNETTGYDLVKWLVAYCIEEGYNIPVCYFHTNNIIGKRNMETYYNNAVEFLQREMQ